MANDRPQTTASSEGTPPFEVALGATGGLLVLAIAGYLVWSALSGAEDGHPDPEVELLAPIAQLHGWVVPFRVTNKGNAAASQVRIEATLDGPAGAPAERLRGEAVIDYLATSSTMEGGFFFPRDPADGRLSARALSYVKP